MCYVFFSIFLSLPTILSQNWIYSLIGPAIHFIIATIGTGVDLYIKYFNKDHRTNTRYDDKWLFFESYTKAHNLFDYLLNTDNIAYLVPIPFGYHLIWGCFYCHCILALTNIMTLKFHILNDTITDNRTWVELCFREDYGTDEEVENGACLLRHTCFTVFISFHSYILGNAFVLLSTLKDESKQRIFLSQYFLHQRFSHTDITIQDINKTIEKQVKYIKDYTITVTCGNNYKFEIKYLKVLLLFIAVLTSINLLFIETSFFTNSNNFYAQLIYVLSIPLTALSLYGIINVLWRIYNLYKVSFIIMKQLGNSLKILSKTDIIEWIELRKHYLLYRLPMRYYYGSFGVCFFHFFLTFILLFFAVFFIVLENEGLEYYYGQSSGFIVLLSTIVLALSMLYTMSIVVNIFDQQKRHKIMLYHEKVRLNYLFSKFNDEIDNINGFGYDKKVIVNANRFQDCADLVDAVINWLQYSDKPATIAGIHMTNELLFGSTAYVFAAIASIAAKLMFDYFVDV